MNRRTIKIITTIVTFVIIMTLTASVFAFKPTDMNAQINQEASNQIKTFGQNIMGVLQTVGVVVAVVILIVLVIKYMMGSASEKAEYKKTMMPYLIGAILIFAATTIANVVYQFANGL